MADERDREHREGWEGRSRQGWEGRGREDWSRGEWGREYWPRERWGAPREGWGGRPDWGGGEWGGREGWGAGEPPYRGRGEWGGEGRWGREGWGGEPGREGAYRGGMSYYGGGYGGAYGGGIGYGQPVRGRYAGRGPRNYQRPDDRIRDDVIEQLTRHPDIDASDIDVQVRGGEVTLSGAVETREMKRLADDAADNVFGVKEVHNQIRVQHQPAPMARESR